LKKAISIKKERKDEFLMAIKNKLLTFLEEKRKELKAKGIIYSISSSEYRKGQLDALQLIIDKINNGEFDIKSLTLEAIQDFDISEGEKEELMALRGGLYVLDPKDSHGKFCWDKIREIVRKRTT
jgi:hypothetical protein